MLGRDIEVEVREEKPEEPKFFYLRELMYGMPKKIDLRPPSPPTIGMGKIQAEGWKAFFIDYASSATFHGLNHLAAPRRHIFERIVAMVIIIMSLVALTFLSFHFWDKYQNEATVFVINHDYHNFKIVQPSITICTDEGVDPEKFPRVFDKYGIEDTEEMRKFFTTISRDMLYRESIPKVVNVPSSKWLSILYDLKLDINYVNLTQNATWIMTPQGFCQSFYDYAAPYSSYDYWMSDNWTIIPESIEDRLCGHMDLTCMTTIQIAYTGNLSFNVLHPGKIMKPSRFSYRLKPNHKTKLTVRYEEITASVELKALSVKQRNCEYSSDHKLSMWPVYTYNSCALECFYKRIYQICGCYSHFARPTPGIPTCDLLGLKCVTNNFKIILNFYQVGAKECNCEYGCDLVRYFEDQFSTSPMSDEISAGSALDVVVLFPRHKYIQEQAFGFIDFLAAIGGAAGLLLGASILSFVEFFYFGTLRCFWYYMKMRSEKIRKFRMKKNNSRTFRH